MRMGWSRRAGPTRKERPHVKDGVSFMRVLTAKAIARIHGTTNSWSLSPHRGREEPTRECAVSLEIRGDERNGYHLIMCPAGFFTADSFYKTMHEALAAAEQLLGLQREDWSVSRRDSTKK